MGITGRPKIAHPPPITPPEAGGRWLTLGGWAKWRSVALENGTARAVSPLRIIGPPPQNRAPAIDRAAQGDWSAHFWWVAEWVSADFENGAVDMVFPSVITWAPEIAYAIDRARIL